MNDSFLHQLRKEPRPEFAAQLYEHIQPPRRRPLSSFIMVPVRHMIAALIPTLLGIVLLVSPDARAGLEQAIREIGGLLFQEVDRIDPPMQQSNPIPVEQAVTLDEANALLPEPVPIPAWAPDGFSALSAGTAPQMWVRIARLPGSSSWTLARVIYSTDADKGPYNTIDYSIWWLPNDVQFGRMLVGIGSLEQVSVGGQPAALIQGAFDPYTGVFSRDMDRIQLLFKRGGRIFSLSSYPRLVSSDELLKMAESLP